MVLVDVSCLRQLSCESQSLIPPTDESFKDILLVLDEQSFVL